MLLLLLERSFCQTDFKLSSCLSAYLYFYHFLTGLFLCFVWWKFFKFILGMSFVKSIWLDIFNQARYFFFLIGWISSFLCMAFRFIPTISFLPFLRFTFLHAAIVLDWLRNLFFLFFLYPFKTYQFNFYLLKITTEKLTCAFYLMKSKFKHY